MKINIKNACLSNNGKQTRNVLVIKALGSLFVWGFLLLFSCEKDKIVLESAPRLTFEKLYQQFDIGKISEANILSNVKGKKTGYVLKAIKDIAPKDIATINGKNIVLQKIGTFTATLVLEHTKKQRVAIKLAKFEITKGKKVSLTFDNLSKAFRAGGQFTTAEIMSNVRGDKSGYTLKEIKDLSDGDVAGISGLNIQFKKVGTFAVSLVLKHATKADVVIKNAQFEIAKEASAALTFDKLSKVFKAGGQFTATEIMNNVQGDKSGYTLKEIKDLSDGDVASISGLNIGFKKKGAFTVGLVLKHAIKAGVVIKGASFEILGDKITDFHIPGLFVFDTIKQGSSASSFKYVLKFRADDGREELNVFKNSNGEQIRDKQIDLLLAHKKGFVISIYNDAKQSSEILMTDSKFKILKRIDLGKDNAIFNRSGVILNQKLYFTTSHSDNYKNTYILDLNTYQLNKYNNLKLQKFFTDGVKLYYLDFKRNLYRINDVSNLNAGGTLIKDFKIDGTKVPYHPKETLEDGYLDANGIFWALKKVMKTPAVSFWVESEYTLDIISYNVKTKKMNTLDTGLVTFLARFEVDMFRKKMYFATGKFGDSPLVIRSFTNDKGTAKLGNIAYQFKGDFLNFKMTFTKNNRLFMQKNQELLKGNADFTGLKKIYTVGYLARFIYNP